LPSRFAAAEWQQIVAAAKREGKVAVRGPTGADTMHSLTDGFQQQYPDIQVDYTASSGAELAAKLLTERAGGLYLADVFLHGNRTAVADLMPAGALDPLPPYLVGPELQDPSKWFGGAFTFADTEGKYNFVTVSGVKAPLAISTSQVNAGELRTYKSLLDPNWRGKVAMFDPRAGGAGLGMATFFQLAPGLGRDFLADLFASGLVFTRDDRQLLDWIARGQYAIAIGPSDHIAVELKGRGVPLEVPDAHGIQEGSYLTGASGGLSVFNRAPHPNATKVYLNWFLSREGQTAFSQAAGYPSRRLDVPTAHLSPDSVPKPTGQYIENYKESFIQVQVEVQAFAQSVLR
jgi:iron(III) transport system substrate-binding protein